MIDKSLFKNYHKPDCGVLANGPWCPCSCGLDHVIDEYTKFFQEPIKKEEK